MSLYPTYYPGVYTEREQKGLDRFLAVSRAIEERGPIDVKALVAGKLEGSPGVSAALEATEGMVMYNNLKYDPDYRPWHDAGYAKSLGYEGIPACLTYGAWDDGFMFPFTPDARDEMLVSELNHSVTSHRPIYIGDSLFMVTDKRTIEDVTPAGGNAFHSFAIKSCGSVYNQKGELVTSVIFRVTENVRSFINPADKPEGHMAWIAPEWDRREDRKYTDEDWEYIMDIWKSEAPRGADILYWEDVSIGDRPNRTLDGPIDDTPNPSEPYGMGLEGSRTLKREILDPELKKGLVRNPYDGIYRFPSRGASRPNLPEGVNVSFDESIHGSGSAEVDDDAMGVPPKRYVFINFMGRDYAIRHINNWMGDHGVIRNIRWGIMPPAALKEYGYTVPDGGGNRFLDVVPGMKDKCLHHGVERDVVLANSYVYDKRVVNGEYLVELAWWLEDISGCCYEEGQATIKLPSRA